MTLLYKRIIISITWLGVASEYGVQIAFSVLCSALISDSYASPSTAGRFLLSWSKVQGYTTQSPDVHDCKLKLALFTCHATLQNVILFFMPQFWPTRVGRRGR